MDVQHWNVLFITITFIGSFVLSYANGKFYNYSFFIGS